MSSQESRGIYIWRLFDDGATTCLWVW